MDLNRAAMMYSLKCVIFQKIMKHAKKLKLAHKQEKKQLKEKLKVHFKEMTSTWLAIQISMSGRYL